MGSRLSSLVLWLTVVACVGCHSAPTTGRKQLLLVSEPQEISLGASAFEQTLSQEQLSTNTQYVQLVNRVGQRLARVADRPDYDWDFRVIASPQQNAFCLPGGKVAVYEGILPVCQSEGGLAVVMSHEVSHALARHGAERMSHTYVVDGVGNLMSHFTRTYEERRREQLTRGYGLASKYGFVLPYSRSHESEADQMGLILMARAGYDPEEAPRFWARFGQAKTGQQMPEFLSTHPSDDRREAELQSQLATAREIYLQAPEQYGLGEPVRLGQAATPVSPGTPAAVAALASVATRAAPPLKDTLPLSAVMESSPTVDSPPADGRSPIRQVGAEQPVREPLGEPKPNPVRVISSGNPLRR